jgi:hypothetical protein
MSEVNSWVNNMQGFNRVIDKTIMLVVFGWFGIPGTELVLTTLCPMILVT